MAPGVLNWQEIKPPRLSIATALLREVLDGPVPAHGSLSVYDRIAEFLKDANNA